MEFFKYPVFNEKMIILTESPIVIWSYRACLKMALRCRQPNLQTLLFALFLIPVEIKDVALLVVARRCVQTFDRVGGAPARWRTNL